MVLTIVRKIKMPLTVITIKNIKPSLRGDLSKWMQEISTGVYIGNFNSKIREKLWERVKENIIDGEATLSYYCNNEIGYSFDTYNSDRKIFDYEGIPLVYIPTEKETNINEKTGYSDAYKFYNARKFSRKSNNNHNYVIIYIKNYASKLYVEILKYKNGEKSKHNIELENEDYSIIKEKVENLEIIGFDISKRFNNLDNKIYDLKKYVKHEKMFLESYDIEDVLKEYGIEIEGSIKVEDIEKLKNKLNKK